MFDFFTKKDFLIDYLENFVDIHNHILPGIDDGAKTPLESLEIIQAFSEIGIKKFIATPHIMHNYYPNNPQTIQGALALVNNELLKNDLRDICISAAAEHMIDDNFEVLLDESQVMPMKGAYLLVEMSYLQPPINFDEGIIKTASNGYFPILAHPERYNFLHQKMKKYSHYKEQGILFQLNLLSLSNYYGSQVPKVSIKLLEEGLIDFIASDIHNLDQFEALKNVTVTTKTIKQLLPIINRTKETFY